MSAGPDAGRGPQAGESQTTAAAWRNLALLAGAAALLLAAVYLSPLRDYLGRVRELSGQIRGLGVLGPVVLALSVAALVAIGFPRLLFCVVAGMALGFWSGLLWAQLGTLLGNYATFLVARFGARQWAEGYLCRHAGVHRWVRREGLAGVIVARQLPMPGLLVNLACGLLPVRQRHFLLGTVLGQLPEAVPCTLIGAGALEASFARSAGLFGLAAALALLVWIGWRRFLGPARPPEAAKSLSIEH